MYLSICNSVTEYEQVPKTATSDRVCTLRSICKETSEYLLAVGSATKDNTCAPVTPCYGPKYSIIGAGYTKTAAVNAVSAAVNGTDAVCQVNASNP